MGQDALAELLFALELVVERDVADRGGQVRAQIEERLGLPATVGRPHNRLTHGEDPDELAAREERYREDALEQLQLAHDVRVGEVDEPGGSALRGEPPNEPLAGRQAHRADDLRRQPAMRGDAIFLRVGAGQEQRHPGGSNELPDRVEEHLERSRQVEARGKRPRELLEHACERGTLPRLIGAGRRARPPGREARAERGDFARQPKPVGDVAQRAVELTLPERQRESEVRRGRLVTGGTDGDRQGGR